MIDDVRDIIEKGIHSLRDALPEIRNFGSHDDWRKREDAATALVEISKKKEDEVVNERLETMKRCKREGFFTGVCFIPVLPFLLDSEEQLEETIRTVKEYEADFIFVGGLTLFGKGPADCKALYYKFLEKHYPELVPKYKSLFRIFLAPPKEYQKELEEKSKRLCEGYGIKYGLV